MAWREERSLFPYQQEAAEFMLDHNVLLAFDMGAGKTPTTLWALEELKKRGEITGTGIIIAPSSLLTQWGQEITKFTTSSWVIARGTPVQRQAIYKIGSHSDYMLMSYDIFVRDEGMITDRDMHFLVLDEASAIRAFKTKRTKTLKVRGKGMSFKFALTGTPVENGKPEELFSILEWVDPEITGKWWKFEKDHLIRNNLGWITGYRNIDVFHKRVKGNILRKTIHDPEVSQYLPEVIEPEPISVRMPTKLAKVYARIRDDLMVDLNNAADRAAEKIAAPARFDWEDQDPDHPDGKMMAKIQVMRMLLDHPVAVYVSAARFADPDDDRGSAYAAALVDEGLIDGLPTPKFDAFMEYLKEFLDRDDANKAVVFCSYVDVAQAIHDALPTSVLFTGSMSSKERDTAKADFQQNPEVRVFVSTDAGGYGLDLPQANLLINYDLPWQAGLLKQRNARIRRASSEWEHVVVQDFEVTDTIEQRLSDMLRHKIAVSDAFVDGKGILEDGTLGSDLESLRSFLSKLVD